MNIKKYIKKGLSYLQNSRQIPIIVPCEHGALLAGKSAIISGGSGGIGQALADSFVKCGCKVIITGTKEHVLKEICSRYSNDIVTYLLLDLNNVPSFKEKLEPVFATNSIDILVNSAGVNDGKDFFNVDEQTYDSIMRVNVRGTYFLSQIVAKHMIERNVHGHILNLSSASSLRPASQPYAISKWAITGLTKGLADVLIPYGITVNAIAPGPTATPMLGKTLNDDICHEACPAGRYATAQEIANLATFMVSGMGDLIVGDTFYITGGSGTISLHR